MAFAEPEADVWKPSDIPVETSEGYADIIPPTSDLVPQPAADTAIIEEGDFAGMRFVEVAEALTPAVDGIHQACKSLDIDEALDAMERALAEALFIAKHQMDDRFAYEKAIKVIQTCLPYALTKATITEKSYGQIVQDASQHLIGKMKQ